MVLEECHLWCVLATASNAPAAMAASRMVAISAGVSLKKLLQRCENCVTIVLE
jgi:hypothetical protein